MQCVIYFKWITECSMQTFCKRGHREQRCPKMVEWNVCYAFHRKIFIKIKRIASIVQITVESDGARKCTENVMRIPVNLKCIYIYMLKAINGKINL